MAGRASDLRIGFIGLGAMGKPIARHILSHGFTLAVHSRSPGAVEDLVAAGALRATSPAEAASDADVVLTSLPGAQEVSDVVLGESGITSAMSPGAIVVDLSTIAPQTAREIARAVESAGGSFLDAPVSGGTRGATDGSLSIMVGGQAEALLAATPVLEAFGRTIVHVGASGAGQIAKACNQLVVLSAIQAVSEALVLAGAAGVDPSRVREALLGGFAGSRVLDAHGLRMLERDFKAGGTVKQNRRDADIVIETAARFGVPLDGFRAAANSLQALVDQGREGLDHSAIYLVVEEAATQHAKSR
jgi:2-hydroxy-3-oxopropionate reductase